MPENIFFDLDHTIWDFDTNANETLRELYDMYQVQFISSRSVDDFIAIYTKVNHDLWSLYRQHKVTKEQLRERRFTETFREMDVYEQEIPQGVESKYIEICPTKTALMPGARETLDYLAGKYNLHLITNGFAESQRTKLRCSNLEQYFKTLTISEEVGVQKPHPKVFEIALKNAGSDLKTSQYVGDNLEADVKGAISSDWHVYWLTDDASAYRHEKCTPIKFLSELSNLL
jgi:putative hydrolase of the HAD superfamily